jgi:hypothetical protein
LDSQISDHRFLDASLAFQQHPTRSSKDARMEPMPFLPMDGKDGREMQTKRVF